MPPRPQATAHGHQHARPGSPPSLPPPHTPPGTAAPGVPPEGSTASEQCPAQVTQNHHLAGRATEMALHTAQTGGQQGRGAGTEAGGTAVHLTSALRTRLTGRLDTPQCIGTHPATRWRPSLRARGGRPHPVPRAAISQGAALGSCALTSLHRGSLQEAQLQEGPPPQDKAENGHRPRTQVAPGPARASPPPGPRAHALGLLVPEAPSRMPSSNPIRTQAAEARVLCPAGARPSQPSAGLAPRPPLSSGKGQEPHGDPELHPRERASRHGTARHPDPSRATPRQRHPAAPPQRSRARARHKAQWSRLASLQWRWLAF